MNDGMIFDIVRGSFVDGPGIRTTVFFKGCNLNCAWCHNPESKSGKTQRLFYADKCVGCGACKRVCPSPDRCTLCGKCADVCSKSAISICGRKYTAAEVVKEIVKDKAFYGDTGGATFSGGECMLQTDFLLEILKLCKENDIHTAVDTAGNLPFEAFEKILPYTDMFLYDVKAMDGAIHKKYTGVDNTLILENLARLLKIGKRMWVRIPTILGVNATVENMKAVKGFLEKNGKAEKVELLPYHAMGENKSRALGQETVTFTEPDKELLSSLRAIFE